VLKKDRVLESYYNFSFFFEDGKKSLLRKVLRTRMPTFIISYFGFPLSYTRSDLLKKLRTKYPKTHNKGMYE